MFYKVKEVKPLSDLSLIVGFEDGIKKIYDVKPLFEKWECFRSLSTVPGLFEQVKIDAGGFGISWNDELDLACNELWNNGKFEINNDN